MIDLERLCLEQQEELERKDRLIADLLSELLQFRALGAEEKRLDEARKEGDYD